MLLGGGVLLALALLWAAKTAGFGNIGKAAGGAVVSAADGVITGVVEGVGGMVGIPATNADKARALMDTFDAAPWYEQAKMSFQISAYLSAGDYLHWTIDHSFRPEAGAY